MQKFTSLLIILSMCVFSQFVAAHVERGQLTSSIENTEPTDNLEGVVQGQNNKMKRVYFFTQVTGVSGQQIIHRWLFEGIEKAAVTLNIGSDNWRTYSSKNLPSYLPGKWQVQVWTGDLMLISHHFEVTFSE
ncbi:MAG: DUF2914 domain-containing protein [Paraglaciecola sp.]|nr:DUF2914 domain-containing protein [Paraglaciecola sp.]